MIKKLIKYGNSQALVIDKPILKLLNLDEATEVKIKTDGISIIITPIKKTARHRPISKRKKIQKAYENTVEDYADTFKKLAKN